MVIGPCVQLEVLGITGFPPRGAERRGQLIKVKGGQGWCSPMPPALLRNVNGVQLDTLSVSAWFRHRDGGLTERYDNEHTLGGYWGHTPGYAPPAVGVNCLLYLQDMTLASGPLRVSPGSHLGLPSTPKDDARWEEQVEGAAPTVALACRAGDLVMTHDELLHSGSFNTSARARMYMSTKLCRVGQPHRDDFSIEPVSIPLRSPHLRRCPVSDGPSACQIQQRLREARRVGDARALRFFGDAAGLETARDEEEEVWRRLLRQEAGARL
eukprot:COSAG04_NODE_2441_length_4118_cov_3.509579_2_plen_268_part_00